jgi:hypothetical protein
MFFPKIFNYPNSQHQVYWLLKSLYEFKQALRAWFEKIDSYLHELGLSQT